MHDGRGFNKDELMDLSMHFATRTGADDPVAGLKAYLGLEAMIHYAEVEAGTDMVLDALVAARTAALDGIHAVLYVRGQTVPPIDGPTTK